MERVVPLYLTPQLQRYDGRVRGSCSGDAMSKRMHGVRRVDRFWKIRSDVVTRALLGLCFVFFGSLLVACGTDKGGEGENGGGLVVLVESDLSIPKDLDHVRVDVTQFGKSLLRI